MQPYHTPSVYASNVIEIADSSFHSALHPPSSLAIRHPELVPSESTFKKRKIERACDACRRRKTKCDGPRMPENVCTNCIQNRKTCSYIEASKPRGPPKAYITSLEDRLERMESLLKRLRPDADFSEDLGPQVVRDSWKTDPELPRMSPHDKSSSPASSSRLKRPSSTSLRYNPNVLSTSSCITPRSRHSAGTPRSDTDSSSDGTSSDREEVGELSISRGMRRLTMRGLEPTQDHRSLADNQVRFHGRSSCFKLIEPTRKLRDEHVNSVASCEEGSQSARDSTSPINAAALRRPQFWSTPPWELAFEGFHDRLENLSVSLTEYFPPPDLAETLIELYFEHVNPFSPLFHRPTFERQWRQGMQHKDTWFGCLCLSLFAVASRWSDDPRVLDDDKYDIPLTEKPVDEHKWQRAGWKYFNAAVDIHRGSLSLFHPAGLFEVQTVALFGMFLRGTAFHPVAWLFISIGLRKAQDVGAHRKKIYGDRPSIEGELWKRAFWVLVLHDRIASASLGRPCCSGEEDFDAELPLEVDDEYWEADDPDKSFRQPPGKPSKIAGFNSFLKLTKIVAYAMRTIYALDRSKLLFSAARPRWQDVLTQLNQAMTEWVDSVPKHLNWSPHIEDPLFSNQSATLYINYYLTQITIYRPFLPPSLHSVINITPHCNMPIPCIAICVNAGKCVSRILKAQISRGFTNVPSLIFGSHICAAILLMNFWDLKWQERKQTRCDGFEDVKSPLALAMAELLEEISVFIEALEAVKPRWRVAEMYLSDLSSSLPHSLGGFEPNLAQSDNALRHYPPGFDDHVFHNMTPPDYASLGDRRNLPPEYRAIPTPIATYGCDAEIEPSECSPHFFEFPHITRYPVPGILPFPSCQRDEPKPIQSTFRTQRNYDRASIYTDFGDRQSMSQLRPVSLLDERVIDDIPATQHDTICPQYNMTGRAPRGGANRGFMNNFMPNRSRPDRSYTTYAYGPSPDSATVQPSRLSREGDSRSSFGQILSFPGRY